MYCPKCGAVNDDDASICIQCGRLLKEETGQPKPGQGGEVENYMTKAILVTIFCFLPLGIVAIIMASRANNFLAEGNMEMAVHYSERAKKFVTLSFVLGLIITPIVIVLQLLPYMMQ